MPRPYSEFRAFSASSHSKKFGKEGRGPGGREKNLFQKVFSLPPEHAFVFQSAISGGGGAVGDLSLVRKRPAGAVSRRG